MSGKTVEWLAVLIFFTCFFAFTILESYWLNKRTAAPLGKTFAFSFATNIFTITVGFALSFVVYGSLLMLTFGDALEHLSGNDWRTWAALLAGAALPVIVSTLAKRLGLRIFKLDLGLSPWTFALIASVILLVFVAAAPVLFIYFA
jgi:magnesium-transporting ATPase (P-type)